MALPIVPHAGPHSPSCDIVEKPFSVERVERRPLNGSGTSTKALTSRKCLPVRGAANTPSTTDDARPAIVGPGLPSHASAHPSPARSRLSPPPQRRHGGARVGHPIAHLGGDRLGVVSAAGMIRRRAAHETILAASPPELTRRGRGRPLAGRERPQSDYTGLSARARAGSPSPKERPARDTPGEEQPRRRGRRISGRGRLRASPRPASAPYRGSL